MDIVILGYTSHPYTRAILKECNQRGILIKALVQRMRIDYPPELVLQGLESGSAMGKGLFGRLVTIENFKRAVYNPGFALRFLRQLLGKRGGRRGAQECQHGIAGPYDLDLGELTIKTVNDFNSMSCQRLLRRLSPDLIILGPASQIIRGHILTIPRIGTLNAHQGILPKYRGMDVIDYPILNNDDPGITVHFVDTGVDTGDIILRRYLKLSRGVTLDDLWEQAIKLSAEAMVEAVELIGSGSYPRESQLLEDGKQYYPIHPELRNIARLKLQRYTEGTGSEEAR